MFDILNKNTSYIIVDPEDKGNSLLENKVNCERSCSILYSKEYIILNLTSAFENKYENSFLSISSDDNNTLRLDAVLLMEKLNKDSIIVKYKGSEIANKILRNGSEIPMDINIYPSDINNRIYAYNGISFSFKENKTYYFPNKKEDIKDGMIVEFFNNNQWNQKIVNDVNIEYEKMYKLLIKYNKLRIEKKPKLMNESFNYDSIFELINTGEGSNIDLAFTIGENDGDIFYEKVEQEYRELFKFALGSKWEALNLIHKLKRMFDRKSFMVAASVEEFPEKIGLLINAIEIDASFGSITKIPDSIGNLRNLIKLGLKGNYITELPESLKKLTKLKELDLSGNPVAKIYYLFPNHLSFINSFDYNYFRGGNKINKIRLRHALEEIGLECPENIKGYVWE